MPDTVIAYIPHDDQPNIIISVGAKRRGGLYCRNLTDVNTRRCACVCLCVCRQQSQTGGAQYFIAWGTFTLVTSFLCCSLFSFPRYPMTYFLVLHFQSTLCSLPGCQLAYQHARQCQSSEISCGLCSRTQLLNSVKSGVGRLQKSRNVQDVPHQATVKLPSPERNV